MGRAAVGVQFQHRDGKVGPAGLFQHRRQVGWARSEPGVQSPEVRAEHGWRRQPEQEPVEERRWPGDG